MPELLVCNDNYFRMCITMVFISISGVSQLTNCCLNRDGRSDPNCWCRSANQATKGVRDDCHFYFDFSIHLLRRSDLIMMATNETPTANPTATNGTNGTREELNSNPAILHIEILETSEPVVHRILAVDRSMTFDAFHKAIKIAFEWDIDDHRKSYYFKILDFPGHMPWRRPDARTLLVEQPATHYILREEDPHPVNVPCEDSRTSILGDVYNFIGPRLFEYRHRGVSPILVYKYDAWAHLITFLGVCPGLHQPALCLSGTGSPIAKDCGGPLVWAMIKSIYAEPQENLTLEEIELKRWYEQDCKNGFDFGVRPWDWEIEWVNDYLRFVQ